VPENDDLNLLDGDDSVIIQLTDDKSEQVTTATKSSTITGGPKPTLKSTAPEGPGQKLMSILRGVNLTQQQPVKVPPQQPRFGNRKPATETTDQKANKRQEEETQPPVT
jgi:hypothetical protein